MRKNDSVLAVIVALSIIFTTLVTSIDFHGFNKSYYEKEYQKLNTAQQLHMSEEGLFDATFALLDYLKGKRDDIISVSEVNGVEREIFNERETLHMVDVRNLYQGVLKARNLAFVAGVGALILLLIRKRKQQWSNQVFFELLYDGMKQTSLCLAIALFFLIGYALVDFTAFWVGFHELFFNNDLWMLNPATSIMINMFPEEFFAGMVFRIAFTFIAVYGTVILLFTRFRKKCR